MQLHVPSQPFQASVVCRSEGVVEVCALWQPALPYANRRLFCIQTGIRWQSSEWGAVEGGCPASAM